MSEAGARRDPTAPSRAALRRARRFRLPADVRPTEVDLHLDVDPGRPRFSGRVDMAVELGRGTRTVTLHAADLEPTGARAWVVPGTGETGAPVEAAIEVDPMREIVRLRFPRALPRGRVRLEVDFAGRIRDDLEGLYRVECGEHEFAFSQLCTTRARTLFPCFDEPGFKARYALTVTVPAARDVVSNMPVVDRRASTDGRETVAFERTPPLSTYLLALAVGPLERSESVYAGGTEICVVTTPGKAGLAPLALDVARRALPALERWFGIAYPYPKLDLVAVPDFSFGAMENAGAVFFRETLLLADPARLSFDERKRLTETICHELAHMWFGDLVTMAWWDDLWLNESFATWMAFHVVDETWPESHAWQTFQHRKDAALDLDALAHTHPVYVPVASAEEANENFDLITYEKGAAVIRMLAGYLGDEAFRAGVRRYVAANAEGNARAADLWAALEGVSDVPVARIMRAWVERPGHPRVGITRDAAGRGFMLRQTLHRTVPVHAAKGEDGPADAPPWPVPIVARVGGDDEREGREVRMLLEDREATLEAADASWIHGNAGEIGFYRPALDAPEAAALVDALPSLPAIERQGLVGHTWALVQAGAAPMASLLAIVEALGGERDPDVLHAIFGPLAAIGRGLVHDLRAGTAEAYGAWTGATFADAFAALGETPAEGEAEARRRARAELLAIVGLVAEHAPVVAAAPGWAARVLDDDARVDPELASGWLLLAARHGDGALYDRCEAAWRASPTPQARQRSLFALTEFTRPELADRTLERCAEGRVASQDLVFVLGRLLANPAVQQRAWRFIEQRWDDLALHLPAPHAPRLIAATPALRTPAMRRAVTRFFRARALPATRRALAQASERFEACERLRRHVGRELEAFVASAAR